MDILPARKPLHQPSSAALPEADGIKRSLIGGICRFQDLILFAGYWIAPFLAIVLIDWAYNKEHYTAAQLRDTFGLRHLASGWPALTAFAVAFVVMLPFMDNSLVYGFAARKLDGADLAYPVGFIVAGVLFYLLRMVPAAKRAERRAGRPGQRFIPPLTGEDRVAAEVTPLLKHDGGMQYLSDPHTQALANGPARRRA